jgi:glutamate N-acetyltransferase/amino-acid N-acetyltransferase
VKIDPKLLQKTVAKAVDRSFNMITVDGDTSTNDMVTVLCNGLAGNKEIKSEQDEGFQIFNQHLNELMVHLAKLIVSDGEGCSKFIEYRVVNGKEEESARKLVRGISDSSLVKTAMFGRDPNWGRIVCASGNAGVDFEYQKLDLYIGNDDQLIQVLERGIPCEFDRNILKHLLKESHIRITLDLNAGKAEAQGWGADLSTDYVMFNSVYTT